MNKISKKLVAWGLTLTCVCSLNLSAFADSITSSTSVGVNYYYMNDDGTTHTDDFVTNATNANTAYSSISTCKASLITSPQASQLREALKANAVFLNSHGNTGFIRFKYYYGSTLRNFEVKTSTTNSSHVSLSDITLSNVDLIQFFCCHSAEKNSSGDSLISVAYSQGADLAVGFEGTISTRTTAGRNWLNIYQSKLSGGNSWISAFAAACAAQPNTNIQSNMKYIGNSSLYIAPTSSTKSLSSNNIMSIDIDDVTFNNKFDWSEETAFSIASDLNLEIDRNDYNCSFTLLNEDDNTGIFVFDYDIGENITSNKSYSVVITNGKVTNVYSNNENIQIDQSIIDNKYSTLSTVAAQTALPISLENVVDTEEQYTYDCSTGKLTYTYVVYTEEDGVIIDNVFEMEI